METHCLNIAWENVLRCLVKPKVAYLNTFSFSFSSYKHIQCHPFVCAECFKITLVKICRYLICHFVWLSYLCCFRVLQCQHAELSFSLVWQDCTKGPKVRTSAQDPRGATEKFNGGLQGKTNGKRTMLLEDQLFPACKELEFPSCASHLQRGCNTPGHLGLWEPLGGWGQDFR